MSNVIDQVQAILSTHEATAKQIAEADEGIVAAEATVNELRAARAKLAESVQSAGTELDSLQAQAESEGGVFEAANVSMISAARTALGIAVEKPTSERGPAMTTAEVYNALDNDGLREFTSADVVRLTGCSGATGAQRIRALAEADASVFVRTDGRKKIHQLCDRPAAWAAAS